MKDTLSRLWFWIRWRSHGFRVGRLALTASFLLKGQTSWHRSYEPDCGGLAVVAVHAGLVEIVASWRHTDYPPQTVGERGAW